jgi:hypothetical protein
MACKLTRAADLSYMLLDHLVAPDDGQHLLVADAAELKSIDKASLQDVADAQWQTTTWLDGVGAPNDSGMDLNAAQQAAREAFGALVAGVPIDQTKAALLAMEAPAAVRAHVALLTAYDWEFVNQAKELRGYVVAQLLEHTKHPDAKFRLKALDMLGKVTEVALFTERIELKKSEISDEELDTRIKERMQRLTRFTSLTVGDVETVVPHAPAAELLAGAESAPPATENQGAAA